MRKFATVLNTVSIKILCAGLAILALLQSQSCKNSCRNMESTFSGQVQKLYDFKACYIYAVLDSNLIIDSDTGFQNYKNRYFKNCNSNLDPIDFSNQVLLGMKTEAAACNVSFHRNIALDTAQKTYTYTVETNACGECGTQLNSSNFALGPKIPPGYRVVFIRK